MFELTIIDSHISVNGKTSVYNVSNNSLIDGNGLDFFPFIKH